MQKIALLAAALTVSLPGFTQQPGEKAIPQKQVIEPYRVQVTFAKTVHILFPSQVVYVDLGSTDLIAGKVDGAENVVRIKAAVDFDGETNFSVICSDGCFYSFVATYADEPKQLSIEMDDWLKKNPYSDFANDRMYIRLEELGNQTPLVVQKIMYTIHEKSRVLEECICRVESACDTGHFESVDSALRTKPELRAALGAYIRQMLALLRMLTPQAYSTASLDVRDVQDLLQALQWEPDKVSAFWPDLCDACRTLYRLSGEQLDIYVRLTQPAYAADLHLVEPDTLPPS